MTSTRPTRRQFLSGQAAWRAVENALPTETGAEQGRAGERVGEAYLLQVGRTAMACDFDIVLNAGQHAGATDAALAALDLIDDLESQMTVYRTTSEVIELNRRAAREPVVVEERLFRLLQRAVEIHGQTGGAFDITSGPLSRAWGFFRREGRVPTADEIAEILKHVGSQHLKLNQDRGTVSFAQPGIEINLNAIGKGHALDRAAETLVARGVRDFLLHGGRSSILARGTRATGDAHGQGWLVAIKHPQRPSETLAELWLRDRAVGTSGAGNQFFHFQGRRYGHILDPHTGFPADQVLSATVLAPDAATADAFATAFFVLGVEASLQICSQLPDLAAIFVVPTERAGEVQLVTHGLNADDVATRAENAARRSVS